jgi:hypothetical protein
LNEEGSKGNVAPRAKAICWDDGATQPVSGALPTLFWNPTMPAMAGQRCWQNLRIYQSIVTHLAHLFMRSVCLPPGNIDVVPARSRSWKTPQRVYVRGGEEGKMHKPYRRSVLQRLRCRNCCSSKVQKVCRMDEHCATVDRTNKNLW